MGGGYSLDGRSAMRLYQAARLDAHSNVQEFVQTLNRLYDCMDNGGGGWSDKARIWHCLNCLEDADPNWSTNLMDATASLPQAAAYWSVFSTWAGFSKELLSRAGKAQVLPSRRKATAAGAGAGAGADPLSVGYPSSLADDDADTDAASSYDGSDYGDEGEDNDDGIRPPARPETGTGPVPSRPPRGQPRPRDKFGPALHEFTDYQFRCDDDDEFVDKDQHAVVINGERRFLIPGYGKARRSRRGLLIDAARRVVKYYFFKRFMLCPLCVDCKLRHPAAAYSYCRYCFFCHLGGEQECYHLRPELRGTRPEKGKYRSSARGLEGGPACSLEELSEFGYDRAQAITRGRARRLRRRMLRVPEDEQGTAVQALLGMIAADRQERARAQAAKQAEEQRQEDEKRQARERREAEQRVQELVVKVKALTVDAAAASPAPAPKKGLRLPPPRAKKQAKPRLPLDSGSKPPAPKQGRAKRPPKPKPARGAAPAPTVSDAPPALPQAATKHTTMLGANLGLPDEPQPQPQPQPKLTAVKAPGFPKNRRRWASMDSLSTSSSEESIQQFDKQRRAAKKVMPSTAAAGGANPRKRAAHKPGGAALNDAPGQ